MLRIECFDEFCPIPLLKLQRALKKIKVGEQVLLVVDHSCVVQSIEDFFRDAKHRMEVDEVIDGVWEITVTKA